ncbi:MAG: hypothetical protein ABW223_01125, partial [Rariglobus sp.]
CYRGNGGPAVQSDKRMHYLDTRLKRLAFSSASICALALLLSGCATPKETPPPPTTALKNLHPGAERAEVVDRFGSPLETRSNRDGTATDVFSFVEGAPVKNPLPQVKPTPKSGGPEVSASMAQTGPMNDSFFKGDTLLVEVTYDQKNTITDTHLMARTSNKLPLN